jgi:hypothetical protein
MLMAANKRKTVSLVIVGLFCLSFLTVFAVPSVHAQGVTGSVNNPVGTTTENAFTLDSGRYAFMANGRFWVFWDDGSNFVYSSSVDGQTWGSPTTIVAGDLKYSFSVYFNGANVFYVRTGSWPSRDGLYYRMGTPGSNGVVTWLASEQTIVSSSYECLDPSIAVDSSGYPWIVYGDGVSGSTATLNVITSTTSNGVWTTASAYPKQLSTSGNFPYATILPLSDGQMYAVWCIQDVVGPLYGSLYSGGVWGSSEIVTSTNCAVLGSYSLIPWSACSVGNNVYVVYINYANALRFTERIYGTGWTAETTLGVGLATPTFPSITSCSGNLYVFYDGNPTANTLYYMDYNGVSWGTPVAWTTENLYPEETTALGYYSSMISSFLDSSNGYVGLISVTGSVSPYTVEFNLLDTNYTIAASSDSNSVISPSGSVSVINGNSQGFTYSASTGYSISQVLVDGSPVSITGSYTFSNVQADHTIAVTSAVSTFNITVTQGANGVISPGNTTVNYGATPSFTITPSTGYSIASITADGGSVAVTSPSGQTYQFSAVSAAGSLTATFAINTFNITVTQGANGVISPGNTTVNYGDNQTFSITPNAGYSLASLTVDGSPVAVASSYTFTNVTGAHTITATFAINTFNITVTQGANGLISPDSTVVAYGGSQSFTVTPDAGFYITSLNVDGSYLGIASSYTFTNVTGDHTITATFASIPNPTPAPTPAPTHSPTPKPSPTPTSSPTLSPTPSATPKVPEMAPLFAIAALIVATLLVTIAIRKKTQKVLMSF